VVLVEQISPEQSSLQVSIAMCLWQCNIHSLIVLSGGVVCQETKENTAGSMQDRRFIETY
jgi:hypothetical protein